MEDIHPLPNEILINKINELIFQRAQTVEYLHLKLQEQDWHGVCDTANEILNIESEIKGLRYK